MNQYLRYYPNSMYYNVSDVCYYNVYHRYLNKLLACVCSVFRLINNLGVVLRHTIQVRSVKITQWYSVIDSLVERRGIEPLLILS